MEEESTNSKETVDVATEVGCIPAIVASLEMLTVANDVSTPTISKRNLRPRLAKPITDEILKRRCNQRPKKRTYSDIQTEDDAKAYYLDKEIKQCNHTLETIFEERNETANTSVFMSVKKFKRMIHFNPRPTEPSESKIKKRQAKIKKFFGSKKRFKHKKINLP